ncbi:SEN34 [Candida pseudojiufengensis]|uniref:SEN34 n=1 Tax=Candida pseudojiufengensis TaxID=497109 RepID=UPI0022243F68|nr:SEN34 [Candida pseudojiufengensis]KAI5964668.1 SEN34 [Candida pseudojiufengensis]
MQNDMTPKPNSNETIQNKLVLPVINPSNNPEVLIFNLNDIKSLRKLKILGILIGTLQNFPQQNLFLSIPLKINIYDVIWLIKYNYGILVDQLAYRNERRIKIESLNKNASNIFQKDSMIITPDSEKDRDYELLNKNQISLQTYLQNYLSNQSKKSSIISYYHYYNFLINKGFFINPGLKFGGDFVIYPGDPLRYHSYSTVKFELLDCFDIISGGRLATGVKKNLIFMGERREKKKIDNDEDEQKREKEDVIVDDKFIEELFDDEVPLCFSIEWAGFG